MEEKLREGEALFAEGKIEQAEKCFLEIIEKDPENKEALNNLGVMAFHNQDTQKAVDYFTRCLEIAPFYKDAILNYSDVLRTLNILHEFIPFLERFIKEYPNDKEISSLFEEATNSITTLRKFQDKSPSFQISPNAQKEEKLAGLNKKEKVRIRVVSPSDFDTDSSRRILWGDHWVKYELEREFKNLGLSVVDDHPDVILYLFGIPADDLPKETFNMVWLYSHPDMVTPHNLRQFDKIFCLSSSYMPKLRAMGYDDVELMIGATSKKPLNIEKQYDIVFVGNARGQNGRKIIADIGDVPYNLKVWGNGWELILPPKYIGGRYFDNQKLGELYASSLISVNDHHPDMSRDGFVAVKIFDILASGGFAISDKNTGIAEIFGDAVPQYELPEHLKALLDFYIDHPEERLKLMEKGRKIALSHTYKKRAEQFLEAIDPAILKRKRGRAVPAGAQTSVLKRIYYVDLFLPENSNFHWLRHFRKIGETEAFDIRKNPRDLKKKIFEFRPDHIHLGGSVKNGVVPIGLLEMAKEALGCRITAFYGDAPFSIYHAQMSEIVDRIYISNRTHIQMNRQKGHVNFEYMPCPTDPNIFNPRAVEKVYDVCFIGNNNSATRLSLLKRIATRFDLVVAGNGWSGTGLKEIGPVYGEQFSEICSKSRILLGLIRDGWAGLEAYFSNRTVNILATGSFLIQRYSPGLETVFEKQRDMVWYRSENELFEQINYFLGHSEERERIGLKGREKVLRRYTYSRSISRILGGAGGADRLQGKKDRKFNSSNGLKLHIGCGNNLLTGYVNIDKYNPLADRQLDAARLDYEDNSVEEIFTSHMIEHVPVNEFRQILRVWRRVLRIGGRLIIRCPNHEVYLRMWLERDDDYRWNSGINCILGIQDRGPGYLNRNLFTVERLRALIEEARFNVEICQAHPTRTGHIENGDILCRAVKPIKSEINVSRTDPSKAKSQAVRLDQSWIRAIDEAKTGRRFSMEWYLKHPITTALMNSPVLAGTVLDIGCGTGERAFIAQRHAGCTIDGIDGSAVAVGQAQNRFGSHALNFLQSDITALPFQDCAFDNAFMLAVIEHVTDTATLMQEIRRVVKPGGKVFVTVTENDYHASPDHVHVFSKETLVRTFSGFKVLDCYVEKNIIFLTAESPIKAKRAKEGECPICSMSMMAPVIKDMLYCRNCGLFKKQRLPSTEALKAALKDCTIASLTSKERAAQKINLVYEQMTWFMERIPTRGKFFDVGASGGFMMAVARDIMGWEVDGNEISARSIEWAKEVFDVDIRYGLLEEIDLPENWFDLVLFWHTLEHTIDVRETLLKTKDIMKPGGYLVIAVPRSESASSVERRYIPEHTHEFSEKALRLLLNRFGFIPLACKEPDGRPWTKEINVIYRLAENESNH